MEILLVGFGGMLGSLVRYVLGRYIAKKVATGFPISTFIINLTGALLLGIVTGIRTDYNVYLFVAEGFLGAYTTFSTFMYEGFTLFSSKKTINMCTYIISTVLLGVLAYSLGFLLITRC